MMWKSIFSFLKKQPLKKINDNGLQNYFLEEINRSPFIKDSAKDIVLAHLNGEVNILKTENKFTLEEKKALGINTRLSVSRELYDILNFEGLKLRNPKVLLSEIYYRAFMRKNRFDKMQRLRKNAMTKEFRLVSSGDGNDCDWCKVQQKNTLSVLTNIEQLIDENCSCEPYCKCMIDPLIDSSAS